MTRYAPKALPGFPVKNQEWINSDKKSILSGLEKP